MVRHRPRPARARRPRGARSARPPRPRRAGGDEGVDVGQDREVAGHAELVTDGVGDGDELHAGRRADHAGVVATHRAEPDDTGAQRRPSGTRLHDGVDGRDDAVQVAWSSEGCTGQRDDLGGGPLGLGQVQPGGEVLQRLQPVVRDRVVDAGADLELLAQRADDPVAVLGDADRVLVVDVRRPSATGGTTTPSRCASRKAALCWRVAVQAPTLVSCTRPMAAWMSVIRLLSR